jgi:hypothetical protein
MEMVGRETESIYKRCAIVDEMMHREAATKYSAWAAAQAAQAAKLHRGQVRCLRPGTSVKDQLESASCDRDERAT